MRKLLSFWLSCKLDSVTLNIYSMKSAGYSGTPLINKLGIKPDMKVLLIAEPANYFELLQTDIREQICKVSDHPDLVHLFVKNTKELEQEMNKLKPLYKKNGNLVIWVSWYKKTSKIPTDLTEDTIRDLALKNGLVDVKVCAVSDIWSGLKLVVPIKNR